MFLIRGLSILGLALSTSIGAHATETMTAKEATFANEIGQCIKDGEFKGQMRVRNEYRHNQGKDKDSDAVTVSGRLGYEMKCGKATIFVEGQGNVGLNSGDYNTSLNGLTNRPVINDRNSVELNQAYVDYAATDWLKIKAGRQEIKWGDESILGAVGWRNLSTSFDAIRAFITPDFMKDLTLEAGYANNFQNTKSQNIGMDTVLARVVYKGFKNSEVSGHVILLDYDESSNLSANSTKTFGVAYNIETPVSDLVGRDSSVKLDLAFDSQQPYAKNPNDYNVYRAMARATFRVEKISFYVQDELLTSDSGKFAFQRNLATLHAVNGWSDQFLTTPKGGLNDFELGIIIKELLFKGDLKVAGHIFHSDEDKKHIADELDLQYVIPVDFVAPGAQFTARGAYYMGDKTNSVMPNDDIWVVGQINIPFSIK